MVDKGSSHYFLLKPANSRFFLCPDPMPIPPLAADTRLIELLAALAALWWALILLLPVDGFAEAPSLRVLREFAPERFWAGAFALQGLSQAVGLYIEPHPLRCFCALTAALLWMLMAILMLMTEPPLPSGGVYLLLALGCVWVVARGPCDVS